MNEMSVPAPLKQAEEKDKSKTWDEELLESVFEPRTCIKARPFMLIAISCKGRGIRCFLQKPWNTLFPLKAVEYVICPQTAVNTISPLAGPGNTRQRHCIRT
jgi:hypothetical protein